MDCDTVRMGGVTNTYVPLPENFPQEHSLQSSARTRWTAPDNVLAFKS